MIMIKKTDEHYPNWVPVVIKYIKKGGVMCPFCQSYNIVGGHIEVERHQAVQEIHCENCDKRWNDIYTLTNVEEVS